MPVSSFTHLTPLSFLERAADVFADEAVVAYGDHRMSYSEFGAEATRLAHALRASGIERGDRVAYMCPNIPEMLVANFGVPLAGAVLVPVNTRLSAEEVRYICDHSGAKLLVVDTEYLPALAPVLETLQSVVGDRRGDATPLGPAPAGRRRAREHHLRRTDDARLGRGRCRGRSRTRSSLISINYTSGTTGTPKGRDVRASWRVPELGETRSVRWRLLPSGGAPRLAGGGRGAVPGGRRHPARRGRLAGGGRLGTGHHGERPAWPVTRRSSATGSTLDLYANVRPVRPLHRGSEHLISGRGAPRCGSRTRSTSSSSARTPREGSEAGLLGPLALGGLGLEQLLTHARLPGYRSASRNKPRPDRPRPGCLRTRRRGSPAGS